MSPRPLTYALGVAALALAGAGLWIVLSDDGAPGRTDIDVVRGIVEAPRAVHEPPFAPRAAEQVRSAAQPAAPAGPGLLWVRVVEADGGRPLTEFTVDLLEHDAARPALERLERLEALDGNQTTTYRPRTGVFRTEHAPGTYDLVVRARGFEPAVRTLAIPTPADHPVVVELSRGGQIVGQVFDQYGMYVGDVDVFLEVERLDPGSREPGYQKERTGSDGVFRFSPLDPGTYAVAALTPTNLDDRVSGLRVDDARVEVRMLLTPHNQVEVVLADPQRRPIGGARVTLTGRGRTWSSTSSSDTGRAALRFVPDGTYELAVVRAPYAPLETTIEVLGGEGVALRYFTLDKPPR